MKKRRVIVGVDHGGYQIKERLLAYCRNRDIEVLDIGVFSDASVDYPDIAVTACTALLERDYDTAILACGTGIGISIAANKVPGIRCALIHDLYTAEMAAAHNHANAVAFGGRVSYGDPIESMLDTFFDTRPLGDRHERRVQKLTTQDSTRC